MAVLHFASPGQPEDRHLCLDHQGTLLSRDDFSSSKVLADAESKRNRTNFMLSFGPHTDPPGDPCTPQL